MANQMITANGNTFPQAQTNTDGDGLGEAQFGPINQAHADRAQFLWDRGFAPPTPSSSAADDISTIETVTGSASFRGSSIITKTISGTVGDRLNLFISFGCRTESRSGQYVEFRVRMVDGGTTTYLDGAARRFDANGTHYSVTLCGRHVMRSSTAVLTLEVRNTDPSGLQQTFLMSGWCII